MRRRSLLISVLVLLVILFAVSCSHLKKDEFLINSYRTLSTAGEFYNSSMMVVADLWKDGLIDDAEKDEILGIAQIYHDTYHLAIDAVQAYSVTEAAPDREKAKVALLEFTKVAARLSAVLRPYLIKKLE